MKHVFIMNDTKKNHDFEPSIHDVLKGYDYQIIYTHSPDEVVKHIRKFDEPTRFYSVGGDGSINSVMQGLVNTDHELAVIPLGTGNDFVRMMHDESSPAKCLRNSLSGTVERIDTIQVNDRYFINTACFGVDSIIANHVHDTPDIPLVPKSKSYIVGILQHVFKYNFEPIAIYEKDKLLFNGPATLCTLNNGRFYGGGFEITPNADTKDGYMDIVVVDKVPKAKIPYLITFVINKTLHKRKEAHFFKVQEATLITKNPGNLDGDELKLYDRYDFKVLPLSINIVKYK